MFNGNRATFAATRHIFWALSTPSLIMRIRPGLRPCPATWGAYRAPIDSIAGFEGAAAQRRERKERQ